MRTHWGHAQGLHLPGLQTNLEAVPCCEASRLGRIRLGHENRRRRLVADVPDTYNFLERGAIPLIPGGEAACATHVEGARLAVPLTGDDDFDNLDFSHVLH